jgi:hypothetical protein
MKKTILSCVVVCLLVGLPSANPNSRPGGQEVAVKIVPDQTKVIAAFEGGEPPTFTVETEPGAIVSIMVATSFDFLLTEKDQAIGKVFISHFGSDSAGIPPTDLKADDEGRLTYTLPTRVFEAMSEGWDRIYYIAEVIQPREGGHYAVLGVSFDYQSGKEEDAPRIEVQPSPRIAEAKTHFEIGAAHFAKQEYAAAAKEFNEALVLYPTPEFEYNIGICHLRLGLQYLSASVASGRFSAQDEEEIQGFVAKIEAVMAKKK